MSSVTTIALAALALAAPGALHAQQTTTSSTTATTPHVRGSAKLKAQAKISEDSARTIALAQVPNGDVKSSELEREHGKVVYSFDIAVAGQEGVEEVNVDARTGAVVGKEHESAKKEAAEEKKASHSKPGARKSRAKKSSAMHPDSTKSP